jgi:diacylglycerol O-acyltransferase
MNAGDAAANLPERRGSSRLARVNPFEHMYLRLENPDWPGHFGGLAVLDGEVLLDAAGRLRLEEIRDRLERRLSRVPRLRKRVHTPRAWGGRPLWVDDDRFVIDQHVREAVVPPPGTDAELLETAADLYGRVLDRRGPLWELWFLTGLSDGRVGALLKLHHAVADGTAAVAVAGALFDFAPDVADPAPVPWTPAPVPGGWSLLADNLCSKARTAGRGVAALAHPLRLIRGARTVALVAKRSAGVKGSPRTSLNGRVRAGRRIGFLRLDLAAMKGVAHAHGGKVNDVVLTLWAGGLGALLIARGEPVAGVEPTVGVAVSTRSADDATIDNQVGTVVLPLPVGEADAGRRLDLVVSTTRRTKAEQRPAAIMGALVGLMATPLGRYLARHQRATSVLATNVIGPPVPLYVLGARALDVLPIIDLEGNIGLTVCAFSYVGRMFLVVTAAADGFPDLDVLMAAMERDWQALTGGHTG